MGHVNVSTSNFMSLIFQIQGYRSWLILGLVVVGLLVKVLFRCIHWLFFYIKEYCIFGPGRIMQLFFRGFLSEIILVNILTTKA